MVTALSTSLRGTKQSLTSGGDCPWPTRAIGSGRRVALAPRNDVVEGHFDVAVIGAGPAGIMAAIFAAKNDSKVVLLEKNDEIGKKILATGNGRCNISNANININRYHGTNVSFAGPILASFESKDFFEPLGVSLKEENLGRLFPKSDQAKAVVGALEAELVRLNVEIRTNFTVKKITTPALSSRPSLKTSGEIPQEILRDSSSKVGMTTDIWEVISANNQTVISDKVILTTGGKAAHQFGSSGDGLFWAKNMGHSVIPIHAALVPLETEEPFVKDIMGIRLVAKTKLLANGEEMLSRNGDILFTHYGVSGPAAMGLAREVDPLIEVGKKVEISIDMVPDKDELQLDKFLQELISNNSKKAIKNILGDLAPKNLAPLVLSLAKINPETNAAEISKNQRKQIILGLKDFRLTIRGIRPLKEAQVTAGGIDVAEIKPNLESKIIPNLYFAGEIVDIDGDSGGYNLQWAWASGKIAGEAATKVNK